MVACTDLSYYHVIEVINVTLKEAIAEETNYYISACRIAAQRMAVGDESSAIDWMQHARLHLAILRQLQHNVVSQHEELCYRTIKIPEESKQ